MTFSTIDTWLTKGQRDNINPGINNIPNGPMLYIISQLKEKNLRNMAQVSHKFNRLIEQHRKRLYDRETFETVLDKCIGVFADISSEIWWLLKHHPERKCSSRLIVWASGTGYIEIIKLLLAASSPCTVQALTQASEYGYTEIVKLLLAAGSPYSDCNSDALLCASMNGHTEIVKLLLAVDSPCAYALDYCSRNGHIEVVKLLLEAGSPYSDYAEAPLLALRNGHLEIVKLLLAASSPYSDITEQGALSFASVMVI